MVSDQTRTTRKNQLRAAGRHDVGQPEPVIPATRALAGGHDLVAYFDMSIDETFVNQRPRSGTFEYPVLGPIVSLLPNRKHDVRAAPDDAHDFTLEFGHLTAVVLDT